MSQIAKYTEVLGLDNFINLLSVGERIQINQYRAGKSDYVPPKAVAIQRWIDDNNWVTPKFHYNDARLLEWQNQRKWEPLRTNKSYNLKEIIHYVRQLGVQ